MRVVLKNRKGFSALEAIFAMLILSVGFVGFLTLFAQMAKTTETDDLRLLASHLASEKLEEVMATKATSGYSGVDTGSFSEPISFDSYNFQRITLIQYVNSDDLKTTNVSDTGYKRVNVTVSWNYGSLQSIQMMGLVSNY